MERYCSYDICAIPGIFEPVKILSQKNKIVVHATNIPYLLNFLNKNYTLKTSKGIITNQNGETITQRYYTNTNIEQVVLKNILTNEAYMRKVLPFIKAEYFEGIYRDKPIHLMNAADRAKVPTIKDYFIDTGRPKKELDKLNIIKNKVISAQKNVVPLFNKFNLSKKWLKLFNQ